MLLNKDSSVISSSSQTSAKPCFLKLSAFKIWSPLLALFERGIKSIGLFNAKNSQIAFEPALVITKSLAAKISGSSFDK